MKAAIYCRVSTWDKDQNPETQLLPLRRYCEENSIEVYREYVDKARATDYKRRVAWLEFEKDLRIRRFSLVLVTRLDRAFRNARDTHNTVYEWTERGVGFKCINQPEIDTTTAAGRFFLGFAAAYAEMETSTISERVKQGMQRVKETGKTKSGKPVGKPALRLAMQNICDTLVEEGTVSAAADVLGCSRAYISKSLKIIGLTTAGVIKGTEKYVSKIAGI